MLLASWHSVVFGSVICIQSTIAHSWIDIIYPASDPSNIGYPRNYAGHDADVDITTYKTLVDDPSIPACGPSQRAFGYSSEYAELQIPQGTTELVATYLENGHVTKDRLPPDDLPHPGNYSWYLLPAYTSAQDVITFADLNASTLLSGPSDFDDGVCAVDAAGIQGRPGPIPCLSKFTIPSDLQPGVYQLVWWWDFTKLTAIDPGYIEWYTTCMDIQVLGATSDAGSSTTTAAIVVAGGAAEEEDNPVLPSSSAALASAATSNVKYPNVTFVSPKVPHIVEADVVVLSSSTQTYMYTHPTVVEPTTGASVQALRALESDLSSSTPKAQSTAVLPPTSHVQAPQELDIQFPATMVVNEDGSLSPLYPALPHNDAAAPALSLVAVTIQTYASVTTIYVPTYITIEPTVCPTAAVSSGSDDESTKTTTIVKTVVAANQKRQINHAQNHHHHHHHHHDHHN